MEIEVGKYYKSHCDNDIVIVNSTDGLEVWFTVIEDPYTTWHQQDLNEEKEWLCSEFREDYRPCPAYNTPLYKVLNG